MCLVQQQILELRDQLAEQALQAQLAAQAQQAQRVELGQLAQQGHRAYLAMPLILVQQVTPV